MVIFNPFAFFSSKNRSQNSSDAKANYDDPIFDPRTLTMVQPGGTAPMGVDREGEGVVVEQPGRQEEMQLRLRGGGGGGFCCGLCAGIACFECCEICC